MESRKYYDDGWGAGKCPNCSSYNTDSAGHMGKDCMDCGHSWGAERGGHPDAAHMQNKYGVSPVQAQADMWHEQQKFSPKPKRTEKSEEVPDTDEDEDK